MSELSGRAFLVTGGNTGIGRATAAGLAGRGGRVWIAARSPAKGEAAVAAIKAKTGSRTVWLLPLDLADLESVRACASAFLALGEPLHVLVNNAGVGGARGLTRQGFEMTFGINHLGHFALTNALLGCLTASAPARVVTVSSESHYAAPGIDFEALRRPSRGLTGLREYAVSKLCNVLFTQELARRTAGTGVTAYALHPGVVASDIWRRVPWPARPLITQAHAVRRPRAPRRRCTARPRPRWRRTAGGSTTSARNASRAGWRPPSWPRSCGSAARRGRYRAGGVQVAIRSSWRIISPGARCPARPIPAFRRAIAGREVIPVSRLAR